MADLMIRGPQGAAGATGAAGAAGATGPQGPAGAAGAAGVNALPIPLFFGALTTVHPCMLAPGGPSVAAIAIGTDAALLIPSAGKVKNLWVKATTGPTSQQRFIVVKNGAETILEADMAANTTSATDFANEVTVAQGDRVAIKSLGGTVPAAVVTAFMHLVPA